MTAVNSNPTFKVNGNSVAVDPTSPLWITTDQTDNTPDCPFIAYRLLCGSVTSIPMSSGGTASYTSASASWNGDGGGTGLTIGTPVLAAGVLSGTPTGGSGYTSSFSFKPTGGTFGVQATMWANVSGGTITSVVPAAGGVLGCGSGYTVAPTSGQTVNGGGGTGATVTFTIGNYILDIPVTNGGTGFTNVPTFTITDSGSGAGAVAAPIMSGPASTDAVTYSASIGWATTESSTLSGSTRVNTSLGGCFGASNLPMANYVGVSGLEPQVGNLFGFNSFTPTMLLGANAPTTPATSHILGLVRSQK